MLKSNTLYFKTLLTFLFIATLHVSYAREVSCISINKYMLDLINTIEREYTNLQQNARELIDLGEFSSKKIKNKDSFNKIKASILTGENKIRKAKKRDNYIVEWKKEWKVIIGNKGYSDNIRVGDLFEIECEDKFLLMVAILVRENHFAGKLVNYQEGIELKKGQLISSKKLLF